MSEREINDMTDKELGDEFDRLAGEGAYHFMGEIFDECTSRLATLQAENRELRLAVKMYKESFVRKDKLADLQAENSAIRALINSYNTGGWTDAIEPMKRALTAEKENMRLNQERRDNCLAGQATMEEAYTTIEKLKSEKARYEEEVDSPDDIKELKRVISNYKGIAIENGKLKSDKRELVDALERIVAYLRTIGIGTLVTIPLGALITKHKEVAPKS